MSGQADHITSYFSCINQDTFQEDDFDERILKAVKKEMSVDSELMPSAPPIVATTISLEAIQDILHKQSLPSEQDLPGGPFEDTRFDQVVDVQTNSSDGLISEEDEINFMNISDFGVISHSDPASLDIDLLNYDSGIEAEIEENKVCSPPRRSKTKQKRVSRLEIENLSDNVDDSEEEAEIIFSFDDQHQNLQESHRSSATTRTRQMSNA